MKRLVLFFALISLLVACSLSASQEQSLNKQTGLYLNAIETNSILTIVSMTHPSFVKYAKSRGNDYFKKVFSESEVEELLFINPKIKKIVEDKGEIHVLYEVEKEYIAEGENHESNSSFVAISKDDGLHWFFLNYGSYKNKNICQDIPRLIK